MKQFRKWSAFLLLALFACLAANAQTDFFHISDPAALQANADYQKVSAWLAKHGAPTPVVRKAVAVGGVNTIEMCWAMPTGSDLTCRYAADVLNSPSVVLYELQKAKVAAGDPNVFIPYPDQEPVTDPRPNNPPVPLPTNCIVGPPISATTFSNMGAMPKEGDICSDPRGTFIAHIYYPTPMGASAYWTLTQVSAPEPPHLPNLPINLDAPQPIAARVPMTAASTALDPSIVALLKALLPADKWAVVATLLGINDPAPAPAPVVMASAKCVLANGHEVAPGEAITIEQDASAHTYLTGPPNYNVGTRSFSNGQSLMGTDPNYIVLNGPYRLDASGTRALNGCVQGGGPGPLSKSATVKTEYFSTPFGETNYRPIGTVEVVLKWSDTLDYERRTNGLSWDACRYPYLTFFWSASQLGLTLDKFNWIQSFAKTGVPVPQSCYTWAPGSPVAD